MDIELLKGYKFLRSERTMNLSLPVAANKDGATFEIRPFNFITPGMRIVGSHYVNPRFGPRLSYAIRGGNIPVDNAISPGLASRVRVKRASFLIKIDGEGGPRTLVSEFVVTEGRIAVSSLENGRLAIHQGASTVFTASTGDYSAWVRDSVFEEEFEYGILRLEFAPTLIPPVDDPSISGKPLANEVLGLNDWAFRVVVLDNEGNPSTSAEVSWAQFIVDEAVIEYYSLDRGATPMVWGVPSFDDGLPSLTNFFIPITGGRLIDNALANLSKYRKVFAVGPQELGDIFLAIIPPQVSRTTVAGTPPNTSWMSLFLTVVPGMTALMERLSTMEYRVYNGVGDISGLDLSSGYYSPDPDVVEEIGSLEDSAPVSADYATDQFGLTMVAAPLNRDDYPLGRPGIGQYGPDRFIISKDHQGAYASDMNSQTILGRYLLADGVQPVWHDGAASYSDVIFTRVGFYAYIRTPMRFLADADHLTPKALTDSREFLADPVILEPLLTYGY